MQEEAAGDATEPPPPLGDKQTRKYARLTQQPSVRRLSDAPPSASPPIDSASALSSPLVRSIDSTGSDLSEQPRDTAVSFPLTDPAASASDDDASSPVPVPHARVHTSLLYISSLCLLICWVANNILWIYVSDYFGVMYAFYQNQSTAVIYLVICLPLVGWRWSQGKIPRESREALPKRVTFIMGACDAFYNLLTSLASPRMSGPMQNLIFQLPVPLAMLMLKLAWPKGHERASFTRGEYLGATVIVVGAIVSILPQLMRSPDADSTAAASTPTSDDDTVPVPDNNAVSMLVYILGVVFYTAGSVYKESALKEHAYIDCSYVSLVENVWALVLGFVLVPMLWLPGVGTDKPSNTWAHFRGGAQCMFNRAAPASNPSAQCENLWWICIIWIVSNVGVNVLGLIVVRSGDAVYYNLSSSVQLPITNLLFTSSFIMTAALATTIDPAMWAGLAIVCVGVAMYHFLNLEPREKKQTAPQQQLQHCDEGADPAQLRLQLQADDKHRSLLHDGSPSPSPSLFAPPSPSSTSSLSPPPSPSRPTQLPLRSIASAAVVEQTRQG